MSFASHEPTLPLFPPFFFFNDTATTEIYTLSLHDALPILIVEGHAPAGRPVRSQRLQHAHGELALLQDRKFPVGVLRSEEHTSELQSLAYLVCRLLLEKKKTNNTTTRKAGEIVSHVLRLIV